MTRTKRLTFLTAGYRAGLAVFPYHRGQPGLFRRHDPARRADADRVGLRQRAERAVVLRQIVYRAARGMARRRSSGLTASSAAIVQAQRRGDAAGRSRSQPARRRWTSTIDDLEVRLPDGKPLVAADDIAIAPGDRVLVTGPSGSGKSTLFRAIAGIWPFGARHASPCRAGAKLMVLPQRPYFPIGTLGGRGQLSGRARRLRPPSSSPRRSQRSACRRWRSGSTRKRTGTGCCRSASSSGSAIARALLHAPDFLLLDEATASLDEPAEATLYELIAGAAAEHDHRLDRPPLDAGGLPPPRPHAAAAGRAGAAAGGRWRAATG